MSDVRPSSGIEASASRFRLFRRGPWEMAAVIIIAFGVVMLMQPFSITLYGYSLVTTLFGTALFLTVSKFPE
jgi:hypothetical protein